MTGLPAAARPDRWRGALAASSLAAAGIHAGVVGEHLREGAAFAAFFALVAALQAAWALGIVIRPSSRLAALGAAGSAGLIGLWAASRMVGLPVGVDRWTPEGAGPADVLATVCEAVIVVGVAGLLSVEWRPGSAPRTAVSAWAMRAACALAPLTAAALIAHGHRTGEAASVHHLHVIVLSLACALYATYLVLLAWTGGGFRFAWRLRPDDIGAVRP